MINMNRLVEILAAFFVWLWLTVVSAFIFLMVVAAFKCAYCLLTQNTPTIVDIIGLCLVAVIGGLVGVSFYISDTK